MSDNKLPVFSSKKFIRAAKRLGFKIKKGGKGSHTRLVHPKHKHVTLTIPKTNSISIGVRHQLLKDLEKIGVPREQFIKLLSAGLFILIKSIFKNPFS